MNKKFLFLIALCLFTVISCKKEGASNKDGENTVEQTDQDLIEARKEYKDKIIVDMTLLFPVSDMIEIYYTTGEDKEFSTEKRVERWVNGSENPQHVEMVLPEGVYPTGLRLDWGRNPEKRQIVLNNLSFSYQLEKKVDIANQEVQNYFQANEFITQYSADDNGVFMELAPVNDKFDPYLKGIQVDALVKELLMLPQDSASENK